MKAHKWLLGKQSWCLGCAAIHSDHTGENIREVLKETVTKTWKLDMTLLSGITTDNASSNIKAFKGKSYHWVPCFGHNLQYIWQWTRLQAWAVSSRLRKTIFAFSRQNDIAFKGKSKAPSPHRAQAGSRWTYLLGFYIWYGGLFLWTAASHLWISGA